MIMLESSEGGGAKLGSPPPLVAPLPKMIQIPKQKSGLKLIKFNVKNILQNVKFSDSQRI